MEQVPEGGSSGHSYTLNISYFLVLPGSSSPLSAAFLAIFSIISLEDRGGVRPVAHYHLSLPYPPRPSLGSWRHHSMAATTSPGSPATT